MTVVARIASFQQYLHVISIGKNSTAAQGDLFLSYAIYSYSAAIDLFLQLYETKSFLSKNCLESSSIPETDFLDYCGIAQFKANVSSSVFLLLFITYPSANGGWPQRSLAEQSVGGKVLKGHTCKTKRVQDTYECLVFCNNEVACESYNYVTTGKICELNDGTNEK